MRVSVVVCTYDEAQFDDFRDAVESVLDQTHDNFEVILVVDGNQRVCERVKEEYSGREEVMLHCREENAGLSVSRNDAIEIASGEVMAFIDDDAVAAETWLEELVTTYQMHADAIAVGGRMTPLWVAGKPEFLPAEFYWLVGVTHRGFADAGDEVRNTFGSNISFKTRILRELGGFEPRVGRQGALNLQAHETEFCARMQQAFGRGVIYNPDARVAHKVFAYRTRTRWLVERAFWQGYSKRVMAALLPAIEMTEESTFLTQLVGEFVPQRLVNLVRRPSISKVQQLVALVVFTGLVGAGYVYGTIRVRLGGIEVDQ